jgi:hypothetical protein
MNRCRRGSRRPSPARRSVQDAPTARRTIQWPDPPRQEAPRKRPRPAANPCYIPACCRTSSSHPILVTGIIGNRNSVLSCRSIPSIGRLFRVIMRCRRRGVEWADRARDGFGRNGCAGGFTCRPGNSRESERPETLGASSPMGIPEPRLRLKWPSRHNVRKSTPTQTDSRI